MWCLRLTNVQHGNNRYVRDRTTQALVITIRIQIDIQYSLEQYL